MTALEIEGCVLSVGALDSGKEYALENLTVFNRLGGKGIQKSILSYVANVLVANLVIVEIFVAPRHYYRVYDEAVARFEGGLAQIEREPYTVILVDYCKSRVGLFAVNNKLVIINKEGKVGKALCGSAVLIVIGHIEEGEVGALGAKGVLK